MKFELGNSDNFESREKFLEGIKWMTNIVEAINAREDLSDEEKIKIKEVWKGLYNLCLNFAEDIGKWQKQKPSIPNQFLISIGPPQYPKTELGEIRSNLDVMFRILKLLVDPKQDLITVEIGHRDLVGKVAEVMVEGKFNLGTIDTFDLLGLMIYKDNGRGNTDEATYDEASSQSVTHPYPLIITLPISQARKVDGRETQSFFHNPYYQSRDYIPEFPKLPLIEESHPAAQQVPGLMAAFVEYSGVPPTYQPAKLLLDICSRVNRAFSAQFNIQSFKSWVVNIHQTIEKWGSLGFEDENKILEEIQELFFVIKSIAGVHEVREFNRRSDLSQKMLDYLITLYQWLETFISMDANRIKKYISLSETFSYALVFPVPIEVFRSVDPKANTPMSIDIPSQELLPYVIKYIQVSLELLINPLNPGIQGKILNLIQFTEQLSQETSAQKAIQVASRGEIIGTPEEKITAIRVELAALSGQEFHEIGTKEGLKKLVERYFQVLKFARPEGQKIVLALTNASGIQNSAYLSIDVVLDFLNNQINQYFPDGRDSQQSESDETSNNEAGFNLESIIQFPISYELINRLTEFRLPEVKSLSIQLHSLPEHLACYSNILLKALAGGEFTTSDKAEIKAWATKLLKESEELRSQVEVVTATENEFTEEVDWSGQMWVNNALQQILQAMHSNSDQEDGSNISRMCFAISSINQKMDELRDPLTYLHLFNPRGNIQNGPTLLGNLFFNLRRSLDANIQQQYSHLTIEDWKLLRLIFSTIESPQETPSFRITLEMVYQNPRLAKVLENLGLWILKFSENSENSELEE